MAEYINRENAHKSLDDLSSELLLCTVDDTFISLAKAHDRIEELPAANVVEVVRCRACKHYYHGTCTNDFALNLMRENDFCSYGERRSDNE